jgi:hypothetical protein
MELSTRRTKADIFSAACISEYHAIHNSCDRTGCGWTDAEDRLRPATRVAQKRIISFLRKTNLAKPLPLFACIRCLLYLL